jgi:predicted metalloprotease with PDZ domain
MKTRPTFKPALLAMSILFGALDLGSAQTNVEPIRYIVSFPAAQNHYIEVEATYPTSGRSAVEIMMAVWTPGSYLIREYQRHVEALRVEGPNEGLTAVKTRKNRWKIETGGAAEIKVRYSVYCREMTVRNNWVEADFAMLNGAPTFITLVDGLERPHDIELRLPDSWERSVTGLPDHPDGKPNHYLAPDFDIVVDSPIVAGNPAVYEFEVGGVAHYLVNLGEGGIWDGPRSASDTKKIVEAAYDLWKVIPYEKYVFLNMITEAGGGLEHLNSTLLMTSRWRSRTEKDYRRWLGLVCHEFFHAWNVKRLRPKALGPFDYENENYTRSLWVAEGLTSYYDDLLLKRSGLYTQKQYLEALGRQIESLQTTPGRLVHPVEMSSYDAWIKGYRRDENSVNTSISYYTKGAVIGFLLDAKIRELTSDRKSLDDVMLAAYDSYSGESGFTPEEFRAIASELAGADLSEWFRQVLETTQELSYDQALAYYGLKFQEPDTEKKTLEGASAKETKEAGDDEESKAWLGLVTRVQNGRLLVAQVHRETPAYEQGFNVGDEILAIDDYRVAAERWKDRLTRYRPEDRASILVARREKLRRIDVVFGSQPPKVWKLEVDSEATEEQKARFERWLRAK